MSSTAPPPPAGRLRHRDDRRLLLRAAEELRLRRRALAGAVVTRRARTHRADRGGRPVDPRHPRAWRSRSTTRARTRPSTPRRSPPCSCSRTARAGSRPGWPRVRRGPDRRLGQPLYDWAEASPMRDAVRRGPGPAVAGGRHDRLRRASTPPRFRGRCGPTASSTPSRTASSAATSCASACTPPSNPTTSPARPPASTGCWNESPDRKSLTGPRPR